MNDLSTIRVEKANAPAATLEIHERAADAGCYEFVGEAWAVWDLDEGLLRSAREADPRFVPLRCRRIYRSPAGTEERHDYFVIGRYIEHAKEGYESAYLRLESVPRGFPFPAGKIQPLRTLWAEWEKGSPEFVSATPPVPLPFGPWVVEQMRALRKLFDSAIRIDGDEVRQGDFTSDKIRAILEAETRRDEDQMARAREDARYRCRHNWKQLRDAADNDRWVPEPPQPKPFVDLKG